MDFDILSKENCVKIKRKFLRALFVLLLGLGLFLAIYYVNIFYKKTTMKENVLCFGELNEVAFLLNSDDFTICRVDAVSEIDVEDCGNIIVGETELNDVHQDFFLSVLQRGGRLLLLGDVGKAEIADYFRFEKNEIEESPESISRLAKGEEAEEMAFVLLGTVIYILGKEEIMVDVFVEGMDKSELLTKAVQYCFMHDYTGQTEKNILTAPLLFGKIISYKRTYVTEEFMFSIVFEVDVNRENPNPAGMEIRTYIRTYQETEHIMCGKGYISVAMKQKGWWNVKEDTILYRIDLPVCTVEGAGK